MYFYAADVSKAYAVAAAIASNFPRYKMKGGARPDPEWKAYLEECYPTHSRHKQQILNFEVIEAVKREGDRLLSPHVIDHTIRFKMPTDRSGFSDLAGLNGFTARSEFQDERAAEWEFAIIVNNTMVIALDAMNEVTWKLIDLAEKTGGQYDGWGTLAILR